jgi:uncharacterized membrane protein YfcA
MFAGLIGSWWVLIILGIAAGVISGLLGIGSGVVMVPTLVILFTMPQKSAQGISLAVMVPMAITGAIRYKLNPDIEIHLGSAVLIGMGAVAGALIGSEIVRHVPAGILKKVFSIFLLLIAVKMFLTPAKPEKPADDNQAIQATTPDSAVPKE